MMKSRLIPSTLTAFIISTVSLLPASADCTIQPFKCGGGQLVEVHYVDGSSNPDNVGFGNDGRTFLTLSGDGTSRVGGEVKGTSPRLGQFRALELNILRIPGDDFFFSDFATLHLCFLNRQTQAPFSIDIPLVSLSESRFTPISGTQAPWVELFIDRDFVVAKNSQAADAALVGFQYIVGPSTNFLTLNALGKVTVTNDGQDPVVTIDRQFMQTKGCEALGPNQCALTAQQRAARLRLQAVARQAALKQRLRSRGRN